MSTFDDFMIGQAVSSGEELRRTQQELRGAKAQIDTLLSQNAALLEALEKYGLHHANCQMGSASLPPKCTCGFSTALSSARDTGGGE